jgi:pre-mRNA-splicing factor CWC22
MLRDRFSDPYMQDVFSGLFPRENARDTRFAINFFTSIGLGGLTDGLRGTYSHTCCVRIILCF